MKIRKKMLLDFTISIATSMVPMAVLQLIVLPYMGKKMDSEMFGVVTVLVTIISIIPQAFGNSLNNTRLIHQSEYSSYVTGDYSRLLKINIELNVACCAICLLFFNSVLSLADGVLFLIICSLWLCNEYYTVVFRIELDYINYLICNVFLSVGYLLGLVIFRFTGAWQLIYICGLLFSILFIVFKKNYFVREKGPGTKMFKSIVKTESMLVVAGGLNSANNYMDRLLIAPLLGWHLVSVYFAATVFTKLISLVVGPISTVILSYLARSNSADKRMFDFSLYIGLAVAGIGYILCIFLGKYILMLLYPQFLDEAMKYIYITSATSMFALVYSLLNPFLLKYCKRSYQISINVIGIALFVALSLALVKSLGLWSICIAGIVSMPTKVLIQIIVFNKVVRKANEQSGEEKVEPQ